ncbi:hypothetical protein JTB14_012732 [Gonioctena quinquepunctata]|nr:hypothetical protein JTB14_012732 [Gonioctena quinquepunctata]
MGCPDLPEEIDPDIPITHNQDLDDQLNAVDVDMSDTFNLQNDSCENIEIIHIGTALDTAETSELPHPNPAPESIKEKSKPQEKRKEKVNAIHASTMYCTYQHK